jgi:hypothetical protein
MPLEAPVIITTLSKKTFAPKVLQHPVFVVYFTVGAKHFVCKMLRPYQDTAILRCTKCSRKYYGPSRERRGFISG